MATTNNAAENLGHMLEAQDRNYAWLSRETGIPYKRILAEVKHMRRPITLETTVKVAEVLGADLSEVAA